MRLCIANALKGREFVIRGEHNMDELSCECVKILDHDEEDVKDCKCQIAFVDGKPLMTFEEIRAKYDELIIIESTRPRTEKPSCCVHNDEIELLRRKLDDVEKKLNKLLLTIG